MLRDKPEFMELKEGRDLYRRCRELVRGSVWDGVLFPEPESASERMETKARDLELDRYWEEFVDIPTTPISYEAVSGILDARANA